VEGGSLRAGESSSMDDATIVVWAVSALSSSTEVRVHQSVAFRSSGQCQQNSQL